MQSTLKATLTLTLICVAVPAFSQEGINRNFRDLGSDGGGRVQSNFAITIPVEDGDAIKQQEEALRAFYRLAANSCAMVIETIAETCEVKNVTTNVNSRERSATGPQLTVNGQITMVVKFKPEISKPAP